jgi:hypothetical protein
MAKGTKEQRLRGKKKYYLKYSHHDINSNMRYTKDERDLILAHIISDVELSRFLGRSLMAIQTKRAKLKKWGW